MNSIRIASLALVGFAASVETALAGPLAGVPGPIVGVGLPALVLIVGAYLMGQKLFGRNE
jgi:mannose/fructose/N-acetylgalactosamine-specific phosphotransferase system component IID